MERGAAAENQKKKLKKKNKEGKSGAEMEQEEQARQPEIVFFDVETTVPSAKGQGYSLLEFGAIIVCPRRLVELSSFSTLVRPPPPPAPQISSASLRCNGITPEFVAAAPTFSEIADQVFNILNERVWAGHNILRFDCARINEAFTAIGRPAPQPKGTIDTLPLLTQRFGRRAGDMKMASLATYFGLGRQTHRSLDDVRMNLEVLRYCATVLFLESNLPDAPPVNCLINEGNAIHYRDDGNLSLNGAVSNLESPGDPQFSSQQIEPLLQTRAPAMFRTTESSTDPFDLMVHIEKMRINQTIEEASKLELPEFSDGYSSFSGFLEPTEVLADCIRVDRVPDVKFDRRILFHKDIPFQIFCKELKVQYGISTKYHDHAGRPKLNIVVKVPDNLSSILDICDKLAQRSLVDCGSTSEWISVVKKNGFISSSSVRLHIPFRVIGDVTVLSTEIHQRQMSGNTKKVSFSKTDTAELEVLLFPGTVIDAYFSVDVYDYQQRAGIRLVAKRLVLHPI